MHKTYLIWGALLAGLAVILGAFGAHGLKKFVEPETIITYQTGVQYHFYHAFALIIAGMLYERFQNNYIHFSGMFFLAGILLFSGSLYAFACLKAMNKPVLSFLGPLTPLGGLLFIAGWILLVIGLLRK
jgi:uncharacterized membrane protein YgdD (TMEM256/DUF423 family)